VPTATLHGENGRQVGNGLGSLPVPALRCYVYRQAPEKWVAECVDLDLMAKARTSDLAAHGLRDAMSGYLKTASGGSLTGLLPRPSPLSHRLRYHWFCLKAAFTIGRHNFRIIDCSPGHLTECI
jgi:hypothetical protein